MSSTGPFIDISVPLSDRLPTWPGDPNTSIEPTQRIADGFDANVSRLGISTHAGTHVDAPWHMIDDGPRLASVLLSDLIGPCYVVDLTHLDHHLEAADLAGAGIPAGTQKLLIKTRNSRQWDTPEHEFERGFIALNPGAAQWIVDHGIRTVGIDYHSVEPFDGDGSTHQILLGARVVPLETLDLRSVEPGPYTLICLPLRIDNGDGAPCRAVLSPDQTQSS